MQKVQDPQTDCGSQIDFTVKFLFFCSVISVNPSTDYLYTAVTLHNLAETYQDGIIIVPKSWPDLS